MEGRHDRRLRKEGMKTAVIYLRTSSATNLDGDSESRQKDAVGKYADQNGYKIVNGWYDQAVSASDMPLDRKGFGELAEWCVENSCETVLVESPSRLSRDVIVQEVSLLKLKEMGLTVIPVDSPDYYTGDSPSLTMIRQILACISGYEKSVLVQRMRVARDRVRKQRGKCEGRKSLKEIYGDLRFRTLQKKIIKLRKERNTYAKIAEVLASQGWVQPSTGQPFHRSQIVRLIKQ